jgi:Ca2+-binding RTX toxin-like protein
MITKQTYSLLALYVYSAEDEEDKPNLPSYWDQLLNQPEGTGGFAYTVYQNTATQEIVISFRGSDGLSDVPTNIGLSISQERQAAEVYTRILRQYGSDANISFTGHSLGGGLAATMGVWFNRTAVVFDPAPTQLAATNEFVVSKVVESLGATAPSSILQYQSNIAAEFVSRESKVTSYFAPGSAVYSLNYEWNTITGAGQGNAVNFGIANMGSLTNRVNMHSQALLTAGLLTPTFAQGTIAVQRALPIIFSKSLYNLKASESDPNLLIDLIRSEQQNSSTGNGKLTHLAIDLNKLGTNIAGLNEAAQDAIIAQGIEWYYWQGTDYAGQQFFVNNEAQPSLIQYTTAMGQGLQGAQDKAASYVRNWLSAAYTSSTGDTQFPSFGTSFDQWNAAASNTGVTATARDATKSQIFLGQGGADEFTGGNKNDVLLAGAGNDTLNGMGGNDYLEGGSGADIYNFSGTFGQDTVVDAGGVGEIRIDGDIIRGGKLLVGSDKLWISDDDKYKFVQQDNGDLVIQRSTGRDRVTIKGWQNNQLGINLENAPKPPTPAPVGPLVFNGDQRAKLIGSETQMSVQATEYSFGRYAWDETSWAADGSLTGGVQDANFADVINASSAGNNGAVMHGFGGNDALSGSSGKDDIYGGDGDDLIGGGDGSDNIVGGSGRDFIFSARTLSVPQRSKSTGAFELPQDGTGIRISGPTWGEYFLPPRQGSAATFLVGVGGPTDLADDVVDSGDGDDRVYGGDLLLAGVTLKSPGNEWANWTKPNGAEVLVGDDAIRIAFAIQRRANILISIGFSGRTLTKGRAMNDATWGIAA